MKLPMEYYADDIKWKWPAFRVYLPKGLVSIQRDGKPCGAMYLDIAHVPKGKAMDMPMSMHMELLNVIGWPDTTGGKIPVVTSSYEGLEVTLFIDLDSPEGGLGYAASAQLEKNTFRTLVGQMHEKLKSPNVTDEVDDLFLSKILALALNILLYLSSLKTEYQADTRVIRAPKMEGDHQIPGLYHAKFVGQSQLKPGSKGHKAEIHHTGIELPAHWRGGHHRWQRYGKGNKELKLIWINAYHTGVLEDDEQL
jgi:hypothetical protein